MKIQFAPLHVPLQRRYQTAFVAAMAALMILGPFVATAFIIYIIFFTNHWLAGLLYLYWIFVLDIDTPDAGGREIGWMRNGRLWKLYVDYFPMKLEKTSDFELDPKKNYLFACFPHGLLPNGPFTVFSTNYGGFDKISKFHKPRLLTLKQNFCIPLLREIFLGHGWCSVNAKSINHLLGRAEGGNAVALLVGGAEEVLYMKNYEYKVILKNRKGFVRLALKNGCPLVPVFSFGENELYNPLEFPKDSLVKQLQKWLKEITGITPPLAHGRGIFQYSFGILPFRIPLTVVVGEPIHVEKTENPTQQQIDEVHEIFIQRLTEIFEANKGKYLKDGDKKRLIIL